MLAIKNNPVRLMAIISSAIALLAFYVPALPVSLIIPLVMAIFGTGEVVRSKVQVVSNVHVVESTNVPASDTIA